MKMMVVKNCYCPKCKKNVAERILIKNIGYIGINCLCGNKEKANLKKIDYFNLSLIKL